MRNALWIGALVVSLAATGGLTGCGAASDANVDGTTGDDSAALTRSQFEAGATVVTTARLRFRMEPSSSADVIETLATGTKLTIVTGQAENGFYNVTRSDGFGGFCHGDYLALADGNGNAPDPGNGQGDPGAAQGETFRTKGTGYYPAGNAMEGGFNDRRGVRLRTLQQYLAGNADYVSVAMDANAFGYGQKLRIRELERKYGRVIEFRVVDTGGAFRGRGRSRMDICTSSNSAALDPTINGMLTVSIGMD